MKTEITEEMYRAAEARGLTREEYRENIELNDDIQNSWRADSARRHASDGTALLVIGALLVLLFRR